MSAKTKPSWPMMILAGITLVLSSYGLFELAHNYANAPMLLSLLAVAGFDLTAMSAGYQALIVAKDGDSSAPWMLLLVAAAGLSAVLQYAHNSLEGRPWAVGVMFAMFPVATVLLFEGTLRRAHRLNGRRTGRVAKPRATFEILQWLMFPKATMWAFRRSIADRSLGGDAAFILGIQATTPVEIEDQSEDTRRTFEWDYSDRTGGKIRELSGQSGGQSGDPAESAAPPPDARPVSVIAREFLQVNGVDKPAQDAALSAVMAVKPGASEENVRRTIRRESAVLSKPRSA